MFFFFRTYQRRRLSNNSLLCSQASRLPIPARPRRTRARRRRAWLRRGAAHRRTRHPCSTAAAHPHPQRATPPSSAPHSPTLSSSLKERLPPSRQRTPTSTNMIPRITHRLSWKGTCRSHSSPTDTVTSLHHNLVRIHTRHFHQGPGHPRPALMESNPSLSEAISHRSRLNPNQVCEGKINGVAHRQSSWENRVVFGRCFGRCRHPTPAMNHRRAHLIHQLRPLRTRILVPKNLRQGYC